MTAAEVRVLLDERFGPLHELEREGRRLTPRQQLARRRRTLTSALRDER